MALQVLDAVQMIVVSLSPQQQVTVTERKKAHDTA